VILAGLVRLPSRGRGLTAVTLDWGILTVIIAAERILSLSALSLSVHISESLGVGASVACVASANIEPFLVWDLRRIGNDSVLSGDGIVSIAHLGELGLSVVVFGAMGSGFQLGGALSCYCIFLCLHLLFGCHLYGRLLHRSALEEYGGAARRASGLLGRRCARRMELWLSLCLLGHIIEHALHGVFEIGLVAITVSVLITVLDQFGGSPPNRWLPLLIQGCFPLIEESLSVVLDELSHLLSDEG